MVQQTSIRKNDNRREFFKKIFGDSAVNGEVKRSIGFLRDDYAAAMKIAANLSSHSKWIPYPFLVEHIKKISDEMRGHVEIFRAKIIELGGQVPFEQISSGQNSLASREIFERNHNGYKDHQPGVLHGGNIKSLVMDMEEHSAQCEALMHQRNLVADVSVVELLNAVIVDMQRQKDELTDIIMRVS